MCFESLSDDMKLAILAKLDIWTTVELHACSRMVSRFVDRYYNIHVERKRKLQKIVFSKKKVEWSFFSMKDTIDDAAERLCNTVVETLDVSMEADMDQLMSFLARSKVEVRHINFHCFPSLKWLNELLPVVRPVEVTMRASFLWDDYYKGIELPESVTSLTFIKDLPDDSHEPSPIVPSQIKHLSNDFGVSHGEINRILKGWLKGERHIEHYYIGIAPVYHKFYNNNSFEGIDRNPCPIDDDGFCAHGSPPNYCFWLSNVNTTCLRVSFRPQGLLLIKMTPVEVTNQQSQLEL